MKIRTLCIKRVDRGHGNIVINGDSHIFSYSTPISFILESLEQEYELTRMDKRNIEFMW